MYAHLLSSKRSKLRVGKLLSIYSPSKVVECSLFTSKSTQQFFFFFAVYTMNISLPSSWRALKRSKPHAGDVE